MTAATVVRGAHHRLNPDRDNERWKAITFALASTPRQRQRYTAALRRPRSDTRDGAYLSHKPQIRHWATNARPAIGQALPVDLLDFDDLFGSPAAYRAERDDAFAMVAGVVVAVEDLWRGRVFEIGPVALDEALSAVDFGMPCVVAAIRADGIALASFADCGLGKPPPARSKGRAGRAVSVLALPVDPAVSGLLRLSLARLGVSS